ncbi:MAG: GNAT family N-acetyltransferase [Alphaproteobacteria bacterium]|jgi:RimJ/RimL family protein N-acetyltransferase|nr:GNAT family N-acetyltransferase [Alphaproteobacteria bacterium]MCV6599633.1 GNAT family N-acetyltransferase [Alphaproteobacteria bacterium]
MKQASSLNIKTDRITIEEISIDDIPVFEEIGKAMDKDIDEKEGKIKFAALDSNPESAERLVRKAIKMQTKENPRNGFRMSVKKENEIIGYSDIYVIPEEDGTLGDVGYFLDPKHRGFGYAREATLAVIDSFFKFFDYDYINATTKPTNKKSFNVLTKMGFVKCSETYESQHYNGDLRNDYKLTREDFYAKNEIPNYEGGFF